MTDSDCRILRPETETVIVAGACAAVRRGHCHCRCSQEQQLHTKWQSSRVTLYSKTNGAFLRVTVVLRVEQKKTCTFQVASWRRRSLAYIVTGD